MRLKGYELQRLCGEGLFVYICSLLELKRHISLCYKRIIRITKHTEP